MTDTVVNDNEPVPCKTRDITHLARGCLDEVESLLEGGTELCHLILRLEARAQTLVLQLLVYGASG